MSRIVLLVNVGLLIAKGFAVALTTGISLSIVSTLLDSVFDITRSAHVSHKVTVRRPWKVQGTVFIGRLAKKVLPVFYWQHNDGFGSWLIADFRTSFRVRPTLVCLHGTMIGTMST